MGASRADRKEKQLSFCHLTLRNNRPFPDQTVTGDEKWILHDTRRRPAQGLDREAAPERFPEPSAHPTGRGHCGVACCAGQQQGPSSPRQCPTAVTPAALQKLDDLGRDVSPHPPYSPALSPTDGHVPSISTAFCSENASTASRTQEVLPESRSTPEAPIVTLREQTHLLLVGKSTQVAVWEPSYSDFKSTV